MQTRSDKDIILDTEQNLYDYKLKYPCIWLVNK